MFANIQINIFDNILIELLNISKPRSLGEVLNVAKAPLEVYGVEVSQYDIKHKYLRTSLLRWLGFTTTIPQPITLSSFGGLFESMTTSSVFSYWKSYRISGNKVFDNQWNEYSMEYMGNTCYDSKYFCNHEESDNYDALVTIYTKTPWDSESTLVSQRINLYDYRGCGIVDSIHGLLFIVYGHEDHKVYRLINGKLDWFMTVPRGRNVGFGYKEYYRRSIDLLSLYAYDYIGEHSLSDESTGVQIDNGDFSMVRTLSGIDIIEGVHSTVFRDPVANKILWMDPNQQQMATGTVVVFQRCIKDLFTGRILFSSDSTIRGITEKENGSGYIVWLEYKYA